MRGLGQHVALIGGLVVAFVLILGGLMWLGSEDRPPDDAPTSLVATVRPPTAMPPSSLDWGLGMGQECLDRITAAGGWLDLCWMANRIPDADPEKDYYWLRLYGTYHGNAAPSGLRWLVINTSRAADGATIDTGETTPDFRYKGGCQELPVTGSILGMLNGMTVDACDLTTVGNELDLGIGGSPAPLGETLSWACQHCLLPMSGSQGVGLVEAVAVADGTVPVWDVFSGIG